MTHRDFFSAVISANLSAEMTEHAQKALATLDARNAKRSAPDSKTKVEVSARRDAVLAAVRALTEPACGEVIAEMANVTKGQAVSALTALIGDGLVTKSIAKDGKSKKTVYSVATAE